MNVKATAPTSQVSWRAVFKRLARVYAREGIKLHHARHDRSFATTGEFYATESRTRTMAWPDIDLEHEARDWGVLLESESVAWE